MSPVEPRAHLRVFVAPNGNAFMVDIAGWIVEAARQTGRTAELVDNGTLPDGSGSVDLVVAPHEFFELSERSPADLQRAAAVSVCVCTEQPGTSWFQLSTDACRRGLASIDINPHGVDALRARGIDARHLQLGAVASMEWPAVIDRSIEVLFMGGLDDRRGNALARLAPRLQRRTSELRLFRFDRPVTIDTPGVVFGTDKYRLLSSAQLLVNIHRDRSAHSSSIATPPPYFEWARMVEAMANGCVVVSEPSEGSAPLRPGVHFVEAEIDDMGDVIDQLLADDKRRSSIAAEARHAVTQELALHRSLGAVLDEIERDVLPRLPAHARTSNPTRGRWLLGASKVPPPVRLGPFRPYLHLQQQAKHIALAENAALRALDAAACVLAHGAPQHIERVETAAYSNARPEVSVVVTVYNYADVVVETLDSIVASEDVAFEVIVIDDHATDHSRTVVRDHLDRHPDVPMVLLGKDANEGLASARNLGFSQARAPFVMVMDADNTMYPLCLRRLADALTVEPDASAAYAILEDFGTQRNIRSAVAWDPARLCRANYIDAQAMWRRSAWQQLGGYRDDEDHVYGWEDWDLWLRLAQSGGHARLVPQILGRYRVQAGSMIALTNLATDEAIDAIRARYPALPWEPRVA